jgi:2-succinyl-5-enolpyruvyl-6-hydroxy-3-cyclohexene-1-carboxylate synthase
VRVADTLAMDTGSVWGDSWRAADTKVGAALDEHLDGGGGQDGARVVRDVIADAPLGAHVVVASSMAIRHLDRHAPQREDLTWHANRGTAGIDGTVSTALGVAVAAAATSGAPVIAIVGDLALLHDTNAWLLEAAVEGLDLTVVVLDDDGGTIFDLLPPGQFPAQRRLFATPHGRDLAKLAELHGIAHERVDVTAIGAKVAALARPAAAPVEAPVAAASESAPESGRRLLVVPVRPLDRARAVESREVIAAALARG